MANRIVVTRLLRASNSNSVKAYADVRVEMDAGAIEMIGFSIIQAEGRPTWIAPPQKPGKNRKMYYATVRIEGGLNEQVTRAILDAYHRREGMS